EGIAAIGAGCCGARVGAPRTATAPAVEPAPQVAGEDDRGSQPDSRNGSRLFRAPSEPQREGAATGLREPRCHLKVVGDRTGLSDAGAQRALTATRRKLRTGAPTSKRRGGRDRPCS